MNKIDSNTSAQKLRLDKWLWAARFFRSRNLATKAVEAGHVRINGQRCKPARETRIGETIEIIRERIQMEVVIAGLSEKRGSADSAQKLYRETAESLELRAQAEARRALAPAPLHESGERPTKRDRRMLDLLDRGS